MLLELEKVQSYYGETRVVSDVTLQAEQGEVLCLLGRNGAGKTTLLKSIMGLVTCQGHIILDGQLINQLPAHEIPGLGVGYVPQGRRLFSELTVSENLEIGLMTRKRDKKYLDQIFSLFPVLSERLDQQSGTLSGGEQQMLAMARALCIEPRLLLLDEPTEGLMPSMIESIRQVVVTLRNQGTGIILVEQRVEAVLRIADRVAFMENGKLQALVSGAEVNNDRELINRYVGV